MASSLTWLDHDAAARERSLRILALFREKESRDELGVGAVRDSIADQLFPGTSTIQTRIRYMLLVPWIYRRLEEERVAARSFGARARQDELGMVRPLLDAQEEGVFGRQAGSGLKRLPSSVYWAGLWRWGIRRFDGSQADYHRQVDTILARRGRSRRREDDDSEVDPQAQTWHPRLPAAPAGFPSAVDLTLTRDEADFLVERITSRCRGTLLAWLVLHGRPAEADEPWPHPQQAEFPAASRNLLHHARLFTDVVEGAARVYNLSLAELRGDAGWEAEHRARLAEWKKRVDLSALDAWSLDAFWQATTGHGHDITPATRTFVAAWVQRVRATSGDVADDEEGRRLVRRREEKLKVSRSRFTNPAALKQWGGNAGTGRLVYRWPNARRFLDDLYLALGRR